MNTEPGKTIKVRVKAHDVKLSIRVKNHIQPGNDFTLVCHSWVKVAFLKQMIRKKSGVPVTDMRLVHRNVELTRNHHDLEVAIVPLGVGLRYKAPSKHPIASKDHAQQQLHD